jgi:hypothetical protein
VAHAVGELLADGLAPPSLFAASAHASLPFAGWGSVDDGCTSNKRAGGVCAGEPLAAPRRSEKGCGCSG